jgi:ketosteroid isomerase-like protein
MTSRENQRTAACDVVERLYEGFRSGDATMVMDQLADDLDWHEAENFMLSDRNPYRTPAAVAEGVFSRLRSAIRDYEADPVRIFDAGEAVIVLGRSKGMFNATGRSFDAQFAHFWQVRDGRIVGFRQVIDTLAVWRAQQGL